MSRCEHVWVERKNKPGTYMCRNCTEVFPCKETDCGHHDCRDMRPGTCYACKKVVRDEDLFVITPARQGTKAVHQACKETFLKDKGESDGEEDEGSEVGSSAASRPDQGEEPGATGLRGQPLP